jgi:hypothetical protein
VRRQVLSAQLTVSCIYSGSTAANFALPVQLAVNPDSVATLYVRPSGGSMLELMNGSTYALVDEYDEALKALNGE